MKSLTSYISQIFQRIFFGGKSLRTYETEILASVIKITSAVDQEALQNQLDSRNCVQRWNKNRIVRIIVPNEKNIPVIESTEESHCYANVNLTCPIGKITVKLMTHRGYLSTLEFSKPPLPGLSKQFSIGKLDLHPGGQGYTQEIDKSEHGPTNGA